MPHLHVKDKEAASFYECEIKKIIKKEKEKKKEWD
jgi:hypothetical protein